MSKRTVIVPEQPLTLIQNVSQVIDPDGELINFQKFNKTKFARLLPDLHSIKIRKTGTYILTLSGTVQWVTNLNGVTLSFALLKNGVALTETIQNRIIQAGILKFEETLSLNFNFKRGDILSFEVESSVPANTFVPSIVVGPDTVYGNGLTLTLQSLNGVNQNIFPFDPTLYASSGYFGSKPGVWLTDSNNQSSFIFTVNVDETRTYLNPNGATAIEWSGILQSGTTYIISNVFVTKEDNTTFNIICSTDPKNGVTYITL